METSRATPVLHPCDAENPVDDSDWGGLLRLGTVKTEVPSSPNDTGSPEEICLAFIKREPDDITTSPGGSAKTEDAALSDDMHIKQEPEDIEDPALLSDTSCESGTYTWKIEEVSLVVTQETASTSKNSEIDTSLRDVEWHISNSPSPCSSTGSRSDVEGDPERHDHRTHSGERTEAHAWDVAKIVAPGEKAFVCDICKKGFSHKSSLGKHMRVHSGEKPFVCNICKKAFWQKYTLARHKLSHSGEKLYVCDICKKAFKHRYTLALHNQSHSGEMAFICGTCNKGFSQKSNLVKHERVHTGEKPFVCFTCKKGFSQMTHLTEHERKHSGEKPYACGVCKKEFSQKGNLTKHERIHTGEKPYVCGTCQKRFSRKANLREHERVHSEEKPFVCDVCEKGFSHKSSLEKHRRRLHSGESHTGTPIKYQQLEIKHNWGPDDR